jgi:hypothetical protein
MKSEKLFFSYFSTGTNVQNAGHISVEIANIRPQMANKLPKTK